MEAKAAEHRLRRYPRRIWTETTRNLRGVRRGGVRSSNVGAFAALLRLVYTYCMDIKFGEKRITNRASWFRLMGVSESHLKKAETDEKMHAAIERLKAQMEEAETLLFDAAGPVFTYEIVGSGALQVTGTSLAKHLEGCERMVVMAVTLGDEVDRLISETQESRIALGVVIDSGASVMADMAAGIAEEQIREEVAAKLPGETGVEAAEETAAPLFLTERFSPGYGDSPLEMQKQVLDLLDAENKLGITLSKGYMMSPSKSITAIMGLADHPVTGRLATCDECVLKDKCRLRREGKRCGSA